MTPEPDSYTRHRPIRVEDDLWAEFGEQVGVRKRSSIIREFIAWYCRRPGARLPQRPAQVATAES